MTQRRHALITGASRGIGAATAVELGRRGFHVVLNYRRDGAAAADVVRRVEQMGGSAQAVAADVTDPAAVAGLISHSSHLDAIVCNANMMPTFAPVSELSWSPFIDDVTAELAAVFHVAAAERPVLGRGSQVVLVSSVAADRVIEGGAALSAGKAALEAFARQLAAEWKPAGIAVNVVAPGPVRTEAAEAVLKPEVMAQWGSRSVLGRIFETTEVAALIAALAAGEFPGLAGTRVPIDGGDYLSTS